MITKVFAAIFTVLYLGFTVYQCRGLRLNTKSLCLGAIAIAMTCLLSCILIPLPTGASISCGSWLPLMVLALVYDHRLAMVSGIACGCLAPLILPGWSLVHWAQFFLEYLVIFSSMGYAGILGYKSRSSIVLAACLSVCIRVIAQILSGVIFFGQYAWEGWGAWGYCLVFHLTAKIPEAIFTILILISLPLSRLSKLVKGGHDQ